MELERRDDHLIIRPTTEPRSGWDDAFRRMSKHEEDTLVDDEYVSAPIDQPVLDVYQYTQRRYR